FCAVCLSCFSVARVRRYLHSFPTRRSSDLHKSGFLLLPEKQKQLQVSKKEASKNGFLQKHPLWKHDTVCRQRHRKYADSAAAKRSEEHTSELQSRFDLVCRLLLEKKNNETR